MPTIFIDESIQDRLGFIVTSFVFIKSNVDSAICEALKLAGLRPGIDEFKSGARMQDKPELQKLREELFNILSWNSQIGFLITSAKRRHFLHLEALDVLQSLIGKYEIDVSTLEIFVDEGIFPSNFHDLPNELTKAFVALSGNSKQVLGLQLADLAAYYGSFILLEEINGPRKFVNVGLESGYDPSFDAELGWLIRAVLRRNFFVEHKDWNENIGGDDYYIRELLGYGVFIGEELPERISKAINAVYEFQWIGCIH